MAPTTSGGGLTMQTLKPCKRCGGEAEIISYYSSVYDRICGFAECKSCKQKVWGKVSLIHMILTLERRVFPSGRKKPMQKSITLLSKNGTR